MDMWRMSKLNPFMRGKADVDRRDIPLMRDAALQATRSHGQADRTARDRAISVDASFRRPMNNGPTRFC